MSVEFALALTSRWTEGKAEAMDHPAWTPPLCRPVSLMGGCQAPPQSRVRWFLFRESRPAQPVTLGRTPPPQGRRLRDLQTRRGPEEIARSQSTADNVGPGR